MVDIVGLLAVSSAFFVVAASPGPATLAAATVSMGEGRVKGMQFGLGLSVGLAFWGLVAATGLGAVLKASTFALTVLKLFGGSYLLGLAFNSLRSSQNANVEISQTYHTGKWFLRGLYLNLFNPKAVVAWMATLSLGVSQEHGPLQVIAATSLCVALGFVIYAGYVFVFSTNGAMQVYSRLRRKINGVVAGLFALAGLGLIRSALYR